VKCGWNLVCDAGSMGTGQCKCPSVFVSDQFNYSSPVPGRCVSYSADRLDGGILAVEKAQESKRFVIFKNIGSTVERISGAVVQVDDSSFANSMTLKSQHVWPILLKPGNSVRFSVGFNPTSPINSTGNLIVFIDNVDNSWKDVAMAIPLQTQGSFYEKTGNNGFLSGEFILFRVSCGSNIGNTWNGAFYESDTWAQPGITTRIVNPNISGNIPSLFQSGMQLESSSNPHYVFPIYYQGNLTLKLLFFDPNSTDSNQRVFNYS
jgi:hypothetical protein